jgi:DNA (cytosine-5)-methyltransferase 1
VNAPTVGSLFSGIGGIDLGLERAGFRVIWQCEADAYCRAVLDHHWPGVPCYSDVRALGCDVPRVDLLCGGFPCQPVSVAGKRLAQADPRWLWPAFAGVIRRLRPPVVLIENVPGLLNAGLRDVLADLAELGFDAEWTIIRASDLGAPHIRARIFIVATDADRAGLRLEPGWLSRAYRHATHEPRDDGTAWSIPDTTSKGLEGRDQPTTARTAQRFGGGGAMALADAECLRELQQEGSECDERRRPSDGGWWSVEPDVGRVADGVPARVAQLSALGNAVVPQCAQWIGGEIMKRWVDL